MVIALERYLIPMVSKDQEISYNLALVRICTTLTKGWFRQFAIDNYPQLSNLDKDLLSIAHDVTNKYPLKQKKNLELTLDPETQAIFEAVRPYTKKNLFLDEVLDVDSYYDEVEHNRTGITITSPVNSQISITAIITTLHSSNHEDCNPYANWTVSVVILPSEELESIR